MSPSPRLRNRCGTPAGTQVASPATRSKVWSPISATASPSRTSTDSSTLWLCRGSPVPAWNWVWPVVTWLVSQFHFPTYGMVTTPLPRSNGTTRSGRTSRLGAVGWSGMGELLGEGADEGAGEVGGPEGAAEVTGPGGRVGDGG